MGRSTGAPRDPHAPGGPADARFEARASTECNTESNPNFRLAIILNSGAGKTSVRQDLIWRFRKS
eukprot:1436308-Prymnesium_polylepis.1